MREKTISIFSQCWWGVLQSYQWLKINMIYKYFQWINVEVFILFPFGRFCCFTCLAQGQTVLIFSFAAGTELSTGIPRRSGAIFESLSNGFWHFKKSFSWTGSRKYYSWIWNLQISSSKLSTYIDRHGRKYGKNENKHIFWIFILQEGNFCKNHTPHLKSSQPST